MRESVASLSCWEGQILCRHKQTATLTWPALTSSTNVWRIHERVATRAAGHLQVVSSWLVFWALGGGGKSDGWKGRAEHDVTVGKVTTGRIAAVARGEAQA